MVPVGGPSDRRPLAVRARGRPEHPVRDGLFEFTVSKVECGVPEIRRDVLTRKAQGQFCLVSLSVKNVGQKQGQFQEFSQSAFGQDGTKYGTDSGASLYLNPGHVTFGLDSVNPGVESSGTLAFDIPKGAGLAYLTLHETMSSTGAKVTIS